MATSQTDQKPSIEQEIDRRMAAAGLRWTSGRRALIKAAAKSTAPLSVPDLQAAIGPDVPLSTLYRIIADLVQAKVLIKLEFAEGFARFELDESLASHHHHLVCTSCGDVADLELHDLEAMLATAEKGIQKRSGFRAETHRLDFFGTCRSCIKSGN
jgi:Fur family transcriptional regulator, ferric uptake regulator